MTPIITGPTGSGKSSLAEELAAKTNYEIVNADAFQMYREIPIISNQPVNPKVPHHLISIRSICEPTSAGEFSRFAQPYFSKPAIWVGTGLYLGAALYGLDADRRKGTPFQGSPLHPYKMLVVERDRAELYEIINSRVHQMIENGSLKEVQNIFSLRIEGKIEKNNPLLKTIGVQQMISHLDGEITFERAVELWKQATRNLAKRQWTWLRRFCSPSEKIKWINLSKQKDALLLANHFLFSSEL
jgi:tRNA A37 N6-isopentenylltransferase MiaA